MDLVNYSTYITTSVTRGGHKGFLIPPLGTSKYFSTISQTISNLVTVAKKFGHILPVSKYSVHLFSLHPYLVKRNKTHT